MEKFTKTIEARFWNGSVDSMQDNYQNFVVLKDEEHLKQFFGSNTFKELREENENFMVFPSAEQSNLKGDDWDFWDGK